MGSASSSGDRSTQGGALRLAGVFTDRHYRSADNNEIERLRDTLAEYEKHGDFWLEFLTGLTPVGLLVLNGSLALRIPNPPSGEWFADPQLAETLGDIQTLLGGGLAMMSERHHSQTRWLVEVTAAGRRRYELAASWSDSPAPVRLYGYQLLGPLLHYGSYDEAFLQIVGGDMVHFELTHGGGRCWLRQLGADVHDVRLDWTGGACPTDPTGIDPLLGLVTAMDRNPWTSLELLSSLIELPGHAVRLPEHQQPAW